ncbi:MAG: cytochrome P450 [Candidatus Obscuribacterales bacterium]|nr:cytochrome P450 [Candidatus Obscuribacterales bacterium]
MSLATQLCDPLNPMTDEFIQDPYPWYKRLREEDPVFWSDNSNQWILTRWDDINACIRDIKFGKKFQPAQRFWLTRMLNPKFFPLLSASALFMLRQDPPDHTRLRGLVNKAFTPKMIEQLRPHIEIISNKLIDQIVKGSEVELMSQFSFPLPVTVISEMLGVPPEDLHKIKKWSTPITFAFDLGGGFDLGKLLAANKAIGEFINYLRPIAEDRRKNPKDDLISALVQAEEEGNKLTQDELLANCVLLLLAGHETTVNLIGNGVHAFLTHPDQLSILKANPELMPQAVDEVLRWNSSVQLVRRMVLEDTEIRGKKLKKNDLMVMFVGAANRDPEMFADPDKFDITRKDSKYLSFGAGIHHCLGWSLAKTEAEIAFATLFKRLPNLQIKPGKEVRFRRHPALRGLQELWLTF